MYLPVRLGLLCLFFGLVASQRSKSKTDKPQGRTLGLLSPLLFGGVGSLFDVPVVPVASVGGSTVGGGGGGGGGAQSDPFYGGGGGVYPSNNNYGNGYGYGNLYGYRPNYGYGYAYPSLNLGYAGLAQNYYGYPGLSYYRPNYNYINYQRPVQYPNNYYGTRPNYANYGSYGNRPAAYNPTPSATQSVGAAPATGAGSQLSTAQAAQLAGLLGQALGSSLRPLVANGGAGPAAGVGAGGAGNQQALSGLLGLLG